MARIKVNLDEIPDGFEVIEPGKYLAKVVDIEEEESSSGNPMLVWTWQITEGEYSGRELKSFTSLQEHALFGLKEHLTAFGLSGDLDFDTDKLIGKKARLTVGKTTVKSRNTGEDMEVNRINSVTAAGKGGAAKGGAKGKSKAETSQANGGGDDDIPF